jgi:hypothetical protein
MIDAKLKEQYSLGHMRTLKRASERVTSWPQWKRDTIRYKVSESTKPKEAPGAGEAANQQR